MNRQLQTAPHAGGADMRSCQDAGPVPSGQDDHKGCDSLSAASTSSAHLDAGPDVLIEDADGGVVGTRRETGESQRVPCNEPLIPDVGVHTGAGRLAGKEETVLGNSARSQNLGSPSREVPAVIETAGSNPAHRQPEPESDAFLLPTLNSHCGICGYSLASSAWITHRGLRTHPSCWAKTGEEPDAVAGVGKYGPGGEYYQRALDLEREWEAEAQERVLERLQKRGLLAEREPFPTQLDWIAAEGYPQ